MTRFRVEKLAAHDRSGFDCGNEALNRYLQRQASQDQKKRYAVCFLAIDNATESIAGFYTLSSGSVDLDRLPEKVSRKLPRYQVAPVVVMGRLAVSKEAQGTGLARALLFDAVEKVQSLNVGAFALMVDAKDAESERFYLHHGFVKLESREEFDRVLFLPIGRS